MLVMLDDHLLSLYDVIDISYDDMWHGHTLGALRLHELGSQREDMKLSLKASREVF